MFGKGSTPTAVPEDIIAIPPTQRYAVTNVRVGNHNEEALAEEINTWAEMGWALAQMMPMLAAGTMVSTTLVFERQEYR